MSYAFLNKLCYEVFKSRRNARLEKRPSALEVRVASCGTLEEKLADYDLLSIKSLKIFGDMNGKDFRFLRELKNLSALDLSEASIKKGKEPYHASYTIAEDGEISSYLLYNLPVEWLILPNETRSLKPNAFGKSPFFQIEIPRQVETIYPNCFTDCSALREIRISDAEKPLRLEREDTEEWQYWGPKTEYMYIGRNLEWNTLYTDDGTPFSKIPQLQELELAGFTTEVADYAFYNCEKLLQVNLGASVKALGKGVFERCQSIVNIHCENPTPPDIKRGTFHPYAFRHAQVQIPAGHLKEYTSHPIWSRFEHIKEYD